MAESNEQTVTIDGAKFLVKDLPDEAIKQIANLHITDLVEGHLAAMTHIWHHGGYHVWNLGRGEGVSVKAMLAAFERHLGRAIPWRLGPRRPGDIAAYFADASRAHRQLSWQAHHDLHAMVRDTWRWQQTRNERFSSHH